MMLTTDRINNLRIPISNSFAGLALLASLLSGCATLPSSGPTSNTIMHGVKRPGVPQYTVRPIDEAALPLLEGSAPIPADATLSDIDSKRQQLDFLTPGDVLEIRIYEIGVSLFSGAQASAASATSATSGVSDFTAHSEKFSNMVIDQNGMINLPYLGRLFIANASVRMAEQQVERAMAGKSQRPQVLTTVLNSPRSNVFISGSVRRPGPLPLSPANERLLDALTNAGGSVDQPYDTMVRFTRGDIVRHLRLSQITPADLDNNVILSPGDRIELQRAPLTFLALGAASKVAQIPFDAERITLAEAIAKLGGLNDNQADPRAIYLFRNGASQSGDGPRTVFRLNLMEPGSLFLAQEINLRDKDLLYIANARANLPAKFISIINQLFSPLVTARALSR